MIAGMAISKITVSVPEGLVEYIKTQVAAGEYESVSAFVTRAAERLRDFDPLDLLIASMIAENGEPDGEAQRWVEQALQVARRAADSSAA
jgi:Arc/MetJ-type ribon-helix-helix transcriptional regulator